MKKFLYYLSANTINTDRQHINLYTSFADKNLLSTHLQEGNGDSKNKVGTKVRVTQ